MQPFQGIRVLDLTHVLAGPFCTFQLGVLGADVIKIEPPDNPDMTREEGVSPALNTDLRGTYFMAQSAGKRSLALDLAVPQGKALFLKLVKSADVLVQNYAGDALDGLGLDYKTLAEVNPQLIYCSLSGFGRTGPKAEHPAYDIVIQAWSGIMAANGWSEEDAPLRVGPPMVDYGTGAQAAMAISAALFQRTRTGRGQFIDVAMADCAMMLMSAHVTDTIATGKAPDRHGNAHPKLPTYSAYKASDGWIMLGAYTNRQAAALMRVLGFSAEADEIAATPRADIGKRAEHDRALITGRIAEETAQHWEDVLNAAHVPAARVRRVAEALSEEQTTTRGVIGSYGAPVGLGGPDRLTVAGFGFEEGGPELAGPPPRFGENSAGILADIGVDEAEFARLEDARVVKSP
ncbi:MAG: CoA transferase [Rhodobacteraceae bacterium]|nr:CoA transferase [Paracoccaceae bacterium]